MADVTIEVREEETPLDGQLQAWINPPADGSLDNGDYALVFAVPDFRSLDGMRMPAARSRYPKDSK